MFTLTGGSIAARAISIVSVPLLTRIYSPSAFAAVALLVSIVSIGTALSTARYAAAVPLPKTNALAINLAALSVGLIVLFCLALSMALALAGNTILSQGSFHVLLPYQALLVLGVFSTSLYELTQFWGTRNRAYLTLTIATVVQALTGAAVKLCLGLMAFNTIGLLIGQIATQSAGLIQLAIAFFHDITRQRHHLTLNKVLLAARHHWRFPAFTLPSQLLALAAEHAPIFFIALVFNPADTGQFAMATMVVTVPISLLAKTAARAFYAEASNVGLRNPSALRQITTEVIIKLGAPALLLGIALALISPFVFPIVFGSQWIVAGHIASPLAICMASQFVYVAVNQATNVTRQQSLLLALNLQRIILLIAVFAWHHWAGADILGLAWLYSLTMFTHFALSTYWIFRRLPT